MIHAPLFGRRNRTRTYKDSVRDCRVAITLYVHNLAGDERLELYFIDFKVRGLTV